MGALAASGVDSGNTGVIRCRSCCSCCADVSREELAAGAEAGGCAVSDHEEAPGSEVGALTEAAGPEVVGAAEGSADDDDDFSASPAFVVLSSSCPSLFAS